MAGIACGQITWRQGVLQGTVGMPQLFKLHTDKTLKETTLKRKQSHRGVTRPSARDNCRMCCGRAT